MKIAIFTDTFYPEVNGIVTYTLNFSRELINEGHKIIVFSPAYKNFKQLKMRGMSIYRFFSFSLPSYKEVRVVLPNIVKILRLIKRERPEIIHIHTPGPMGCAGILCSKIFKIPCLGTCNTLVSEQLMYLSLKRLLKIENLIKRVTHSKLIQNFKKRRKAHQKVYNLSCVQEDIRKEKIGKKIVWSLYTMMYNWCDRVIAPSESIKNLLKEKGIKREIEVISCGIDINLFSPKKEYNKKVKKIVHVGRISFEKNIDRTVKAISLITKRYSNIEYTIIGGGPALNSLRNLAEKLGLNKQLKFLGYIPHSKLPSYYKKFDFFITTSEMETQGLVILEAMASGLPVIGVEAFAIPNIVKNGFNGFIVDPMDIQGIATCMEVLIKNPKLVEVLGRNAVISAKSHDMRKTSKLLEATYKGLIKNKKRVSK